MKFGVREICDVVLKAKAAHRIGTKVFYAGEPVCYFDTLKTSSMEGAATSVYAQGGRGNARLIGWEGERTVTFTMEDALISPEGFMILTGAGLIDAVDHPVYQHVTETVDRGNTMVDADGTLYVHVKELPYMPKGQGDNYAYVMLVNNGDIISEPYIPVHYPAIVGEGADAKDFVDTIVDHKGDPTVTKPTEAAPISSDIKEGYWIMVKSVKFNNDDPSNIFAPDALEHGKYTILDADKISGLKFDSVIVDYYVKHISNAQQIEITADKFGGNYYLEASTLFRDQNGVDMPAEFIIPNCKVQSNFTFTMASSGDPSSFTFTMDAFPDYTRFDKSKKVLAAIQIIK
jgi:hypothetical protein